MMHSYGGLRKIGVYNLAAIQACCSVAANSNPNRESASVAQPGPRMRC